MGNSWLMVIAIAFVAFAVLYLARVLQVKSSEPAAGNRSLAVAGMPEQSGAVQPIGIVKHIDNRQPIAMPNESGRLVTQGSVQAPPEPGGYIADSELTEVTPPSMIRQYVNYNNMYMHTTFGPGAAGEILYPWKTGHYVRSGYW
jgi:hypothetical protein